MDRPDDRDLYDRAAERHPTGFFFDPYVLGWRHPAANPPGDVRGAAQAERQRYEADPLGDGRGPN